MWVRLIKGEALWQLDSVAMVLVTYQTLEFLLFQVWVPQCSDVMLDTWYLSCPDIIVVLRGELFFCSFFLCARKRWFLLPNSLNIYFVLFHPCFRYFKWIKTVVCLRKEFDMSYCKFCTLFWSAFIGICFLDLQVASCGFTRSTKPWDWIVLKLRPIFFSSLFGLSCLCLLVR